LIIRWRFVGGIGVHCLDANGRDWQQPASRAGTGGSSVSRLPGRWPARPGRPAFRYSELESSCW